MTFKNPLCFTVLLAALFVFAGTASAQNTASAEMEMTANVESAVQLKITSHASGVVGGGTASDFTIDLGDVNGLGLGAPATNVSVAATGTGALYTTPINLTPVFSGFTGGETASITVVAGGGADDDIAMEGNNAASMVVLPSSAAVVVPSAASESVNARYVGFFVARTEAVGTKTANFIYEVTVAID